MGSIVRRKPAGAAKSEPHDADDDFGADDRTASMPSMSPHQFPMPSPRDHQFPPGMLPPLDHYQAGGMARRGSFSGAVADVFQSPQDALAASHSGSGATHDPHQPSAMPAHQGGLLSPRGFGSFHRPSVEAATSQGMSDPTHGARHFNSPGDVDMVSGRSIKPGSAGGASSAFAAPAGQAMAPASAGQQQAAGGGTGGGLTQSHGSGGLEGIQRFTRLVDNVMGGSGSSHTTNDHTASNNRSPVVPGASHLSNGSAPPPLQPPMPQQQQQFQQPQPQRSEDSHSRQQTTTHSAERTSGSAGQPGGSTGSPEGDYGQADMEDATVKKRKYRRSTERRRPMDHQSGAAICCLLTRVAASTNRLAYHDLAYECGTCSSLWPHLPLRLISGCHSACKGAPEVGRAHCAQGGDCGVASGSGASVARPVATSYNEMTGAMITEMSAQLARMGQLAIDVEKLKTRNAVLEAELAQVNKVRLSKCCCWRLLCTSLTISGSHSWDCTSSWLCSISC